MAKARKPRNRRPLKRRDERTPSAVERTCSVNVTAEEEAGLVGSTTAPLAIFCTGKSGKSRPLQSRPLSSGDEIIRSESVPFTTSLSITLSSDEFRALQLAATTRGYATADEFVRALLLPHLSAPDSA